MLTLFLEKDAKPLDDVYFSPLISYNLIFVKKMDIINICGTY